MSNATDDDPSLSVQRIARIAAVPTILEVVRRTTGMRFVAVARVTEARWITCDALDEIAFGLRPGDELHVETTICHEIRQSRELVVIDDVAEDSDFRDHATPARYGFRSYISAPIVLADGAFFGTLCAIDPAPARLSTPETMGMFRLFAELIASHLNADAQLAATRSDLLKERMAAELREEFIAILGHDLRNPLGAILAGADLLLKSPDRADRDGIARLMQDSARRMSRLIDDVLDFARGRLGGGLPLERGAAGLAPQLATVIAELRSAAPDRRIGAEISLLEPVDCDAGRIGQMLSNLLGNALAYGAASEPVRVRAVSEAGHFELSVANAGPPIPPAALGRLFQPFYRGASAQRQKGLGLGLYIADQIARAHGGALGVVSSPEETRFTFRMPLARPAPGGPAGG